MSFGERVLWIGKNIDNLNRFAFERRAPDGCPAAWRDGMTFVEFLEFAWIVVIRHTLVEFTLTTKHNTTFGLAHPNSRCDQGIEHGLQIEGRAADKLKYFSGGSPLLQRLVALAGEPRDICFLAGNAGTADACGLVALQRFGALRFCCFAPYFVARSHCLPPGSGQGIIAD